MNLTLADKVGVSSRDYPQHLFESLSVLRKVPFDFRRLGITVNADHAHHVREYPSTLADEHGSVLVSAGRLGSEFLVDFVELEPQLLSEGCFKFQIG